MRSKSFLYILLCFIPPAIVTGVLTKGFQNGSINMASALFFLIVLILDLFFVWNRYVVKPADDFLTTINRALNGDYRARFSCADENDNFKKLSYAFNQFMACMEIQTEELIENRHFQNQLYENEKIYRSALELTCERVFEADLTHNRFIYGHDIYKRAFPFLKTEMFDDTIKCIAEHAVFEEDAERYFKTFSRQNLLATFRATGTAEINLEYREKKPEGEVYWVSTTVIVLNNNRNESLKIIGYVKNIDARKRHDLEILKQSQKDGLTSLYNRKFTQSLIENYLCGEGGTGRHAVIMVDIDDFKRINDTLGHIQGDTALVGVAQKLSGLFRSTDIVGRIGGDEFFILLKNYVSEDVLIEKLKTIGELFKDIRLEDECFRISGSIGVSLYPEDGSTYQELYKKADIALYFSKAHGKGRFYIYGGRFGEKYGAGDSNPITVDESSYVPHIKPIENSHAIMK